MKLKKRRNVSTKETCTFILCFIVVFFALSQILMVSHRSSGTTNVTVVKRQEPAREVEVAAAPPSEGDVIGHVPPQRPFLLKARTVNHPPQPPPIERKPPGSRADPSQRMKARARLQNELRRMERSLTQLIRQNPLTPDAAKARFQTEVSTIQLKEMIRKYETGAAETLPDNNNRTADSRARRWPPPFYRGAENNRTRWVDLMENGSDDINASALFIHGDDDNDEQILGPSAHQGGGDQLHFSPERALKQRGALNDSPPSSSDRGRGEGHRFQDFDSSEEYDLEKTVRKSVSGERDRKERSRKEDDGGDSPQWSVAKEDFLGEIQEGMVKMCNEIPGNLVGHIEGVQMDKEVEIEEIIKTHSDIREGGEWKPSDCVPRHRLAIVVPYRDRWSHLKVLLHYLLPVIKRQQIHFRVFVVEQHGNQTFNKGRIMNAAFREAMKMFNFQCVIFHDVDLVPEDDRNMYTCAEFPKHMSTAIDKFSYRLPYQGLVGGVLSFRAEHFQTVNGYSNMYWGWGGEDDDMTVRILHRGLRIFRPPSNVARYKMVKHGSRQLSELRLKLLRTAARRSRVEGLNNVPYTLKFAHNEKLFTHFMVDVGNP